MVVGDEGVGEAGEVVGVGVVGEVSEWTGYVVRLWVLHSEHGVRRVKKGKSEQARAMRGSEEISGLQSRSRKTSTPPIAHQFQATPLKVVQKLLGRGMQSCKESLMVRRA